jgi:hypothetical protein
LSGETILTGRERSFRLPPPADETLLGIKVKHKNALTRRLRGNRKTSGKRALASATFLRGKYDGSHDQNFKLK